MVGQRILGIAILAVLPMLVMMIAMMFWLIPFEEAGLRSRMAIGTSHTSKRSIA